MRIGQDGPALIARGARVPNSRVGANMRVGFSPDDLERVRASGLRRINWSRVRPVLCGARQ